MWICIAHHCVRASNVLPLNVYQRWSPLNFLFSLTPAPHCKTTDTG